MNMTQSVQKSIYRRGELLAELFLQELDPDFVAQPTGEFAYDFFVGISNAKDGINNFAVEVKATERLAGNRYSISRQQYNRWANSNIPVLLLVVDVKENRIYYHWPTTEESDQFGGSDMITIYLTEIDDESKQELRNRLAA